eukprot:4724917-Prymnesium_polylepis.1
MSGRRQRRRGEKLLRALSQRVPTAVQVVLHGDVRRRRLESASLLLDELLRARQRRVEAREAQPVRRGTLQA